MIRIFPIKYYSEEIEKFTKSNNPLVRIAVIEDIKEIALEISEVIHEEADMKCTQVYYSAEEALIFLPKKPVDIVLIDIGLPGISGIEAIIELKKLMPDTEYCIFTVFEDEDKVYNSLLAGAKGYVLKNDTPEKIVNSLRELSLGRSPINPIIARKVLNAFHKINESLNSNSYSRLPLTHKQNEVLHLLSEGMLYKEIANKLNITIGTVKQHTHKIYDKLEVNNKVEAINLYRRQ